MFIPNNALNNKSLTQTINRVLILGDPGEGKTTSALSFPNPLVIDFDNQLAKFRESHEFNSLPFHDVEWVEANFKTRNRPQALLTFLKTDGKKLATEQTVILDSLSILNDHVQKWLWDSCPMSKQDKTEKDGFAYWDSILDYYVELHNALIVMPCNIAVCAHLKPVYHKTNSMITGYKPVVEGSFSQRIGSYYTDVVRCCVKAKLGPEVKDNRTMNVQYLWQIHSDEYVQCKSSRKDKSLMYVEANYKELLK